MIINHLLITIIIIELSIVFFINALYTYFKINEI